MDVWIVIVIALALLAAANAWLFAQKKRVKTSRPAIATTKRDVRYRLKNGDLLNTALGDTVYCGDSAYEVTGVADHLSVAEHRELHYTLRGPAGEFRLLTVLVQSTLIAILWESIPNFEIPDTRTLDYNGTTYHPWRHTSTSATRQEGDTPLLAGEHWLYCHKGSKPLELLRFGSGDVAYAGHVISLETS